MGTADRALGTVTQQTHTPGEILAAGIAACRDGRWREGLDLLSRLGQQEEKYGRLPGLFYSYLGHAIARCEGRKRVGVELCEHGVEIEPFRPENHSNLAATYLMVGNRRRAVRALEAGLAIDPSHAELLELQKRMGVRRSPAISFLSRDNPFNRLLGHLSHSLRSWRRERRRRRAEAEDDLAEDLADL